MRLAFAAAALLLASATAQAAVIDFEADTTGNKANGFVSASGAGVSFTDTSGANLIVYSDSEAIGKGLAVFDDDASRLRMDFSAYATELSLVFGNDDPCCSDVGDRAWLVLYDGVVVVDSVSVAMNQDDLPNQTISYSGTAFNGALFWYGDAGGTPIALIEIVDNVTFNVAETPEPASLALLGAGLLGLAGLRRRR